MTAEGDLIKTDGDILYDGDLSALRKQTGLSFTNIAQNLYNADYIGFNTALYGYSGAPNLRNIKYSVVDATGDFSTSLGTPSLCINNFNVFYFSVGKLLYSGNVYDYMEGTSVTGANWIDVGTDALTITQVDNAYVQGLATAGGNVDEDNTLSAALLDLDPESGNAGECIVKIYGDVNADGNGSKVCTTYFYLRDEDGNQVTLDSDTAGGASAQRATIDKVYRLVFTTNNVAVYDMTSAYPGSEVDFTIDTSSLTGTEWHLRVRTFLDYTSGVTDGTNTIRFYPIVYVKNTATSGSAYDAVTSLTTHTGNIGESYLTYNANEDLTTTFSCDNGANYTSISKDDFAVIGTDGTQLKIKFSFAGTQTALPKLYEYACFYDCW